MSLGMTGQLGDDLVHHVLESLVRPLGEVSVGVRSPSAALYRRLCDLLPISTGGHPCSGRLTPSLASSVSLLSRPRPNSLSLEGSCSDTRANKAESAPDTICSLRLTLYCTKNKVTSRSRCPHAHSEISAAPRRCLSWEYHQIKARTPLLKLKPRLSYRTCRLLHCCKSPPEELRA